MRCQWHTTCITTRDRPGSHRMKSSHTFLLLAISFCASSAPSIIQKNWQIFRFKIENLFYLPTTSSVSSTISSTISSTVSAASSFLVPLVPFCIIFLPALLATRLTSSSPGMPSSSVVAFRQARHSSSNLRRISTTARFAESFLARSTSSKIRLYSRRFLRIFFCWSLESKEGGLGRQENCLKRSTCSSRSRVPRKSYRW